MLDTREAKQDAWRVALIRSPWLPFCEQSCPEPALDDVGLCALRLDFDDLAVLVRIADGLAVLDGAAHGQHDRLDRHDDVLGNELARLCVDVAAT